LPRLQVRTNARKHEYEIWIGRGILSTAGQVVRRCLGDQARRIALVSNRKVFSLYGPAAVDSLKAGGFAVSHWLMADGERYKSLRTVEKALRFLSEAGLERTDAVVALGGGVVGDLAGFAAAVYLRGLRCIQIPTSLLAQIDSSVGGKTGVNLPRGKNLVGSFHQPDAVIVDIETLATLPARELTAGWCECVKQGAVSGRKLFKETTELLNAVNNQGTLISAELERLIASHCKFKASIVAADEGEEPARRDRRSRKILNFGHTIGHALEAATNYRRFRHGEAVGHGMLVAGQISKNLGLLGQLELTLLRRAVALCGPLPPANDVDESALLDAITQDKKRTAGQMQWVLLEGIGKPRVVEGKEVSPALLRKSLREVFLENNDLEV
jgi:3-dehydroquinate synthase